MWRIKDDKDISANHVLAKIHACLDQGITSFDQADIYGDYGAEAVLGAALKVEPGLRQRIEIVTKSDIVAPIGCFAEKPVKYYDTSRRHIMAQVEQSLVNMATDYIDLLLIHRPDPLMDAPETGGVLDELVKSGKVRAVGVSNFSHPEWSLLQSSMTTPLATNQFELSVLSSDAMRDGRLAHFQRLGIAPMAWSPLAGGSLFAPENAVLLGLLSEIGRDYAVGPEAIAVAWLLRHPANIIPVLGTNNLDRIRRVSDALKPQLNRETWFKIYQTALGHEVP